MRCLYCDGKLPLYRKITHGQFCSAAHRKAYWQEQERLAIERLHQTHSSLKAYRPASSVESILGRDPGVEPGNEPRGAELSGFVRAVLYPQSHGAPRMLVADPLAYDLERTPGTLEWSLPEQAARSIPGGGPVRPCEQWLNAIAGDGVAGPRAIEPAPKSLSPQAARPSLELTPAIYAETPAETSTEEFPPAIAGLVPMPRCAIAACSFRTIRPQAMPSRMPRPAQLIQLSILPAPVETVPATEAEPPAAERLFSLSGSFQSTEFHSGVAPFHAAASEPLATEQPAMLPVGQFAMAFGPRELAGATALPLGAAKSAGQQTAPPALALEPLALEPPAMLADRQFVKAYGPRELAGALTWPLRAAKSAGRQTATPALILEPLALEPPAMLPHRQFVKAFGPGALAGTVSWFGGKALEAAAVPSAGAVPDNLRAVDCTAAPLEAALALSQREPSLAMGGGSRYPIELSAGRLQILDVDAADFPSLPPNVPPLPAIALATVPAPMEAPEPETIAPEMRGLFSLNVKFGPPAAKPAAPMVSNIAMLPQPLRTEPIRPSLRLEPIDAKPVEDLLRPDTGAPGLPESRMAKMHPWSVAAGFWKVAPRDLKILAFAIPLLLALAFHHELPKVHVAATPPTVDLRKNFRTVMNTQWTNVRQAVVERAAVALDEDFRSGLDDWASRSDATAEWSFDPAGFVRPGPLALYRPSMNLTDYQMQFLGMIDKKALSWVVRAADFDNYYVVKLEVLKPGPRTTVGLTRYAVIQGMAVDRVDTVVPMEAQPDTLYRVALDLDGDDFTLSIQGQTVDTWSEPRLPKGGIGFFTAHGEESRVRWVALTHQYDMLGRLCAYLAPYESPTTNGSW
jgi:hypothetical protein